MSGCGQCRLAAATATAATTTATVTREGEGEREKMMTATEDVGGRGRMMAGDGVRSEGGSRMAEDTR